MAVGLLLAGLLLLLKESQTVTSLLTIALNTTAELTCFGTGFAFPLWHLNGSYILDIPYGLEALGMKERTGREADSRRLYDTLCIDGNVAINNTALSCTVQGSILYSTLLIVSGSLPPPQNFEIASQNSSVIELHWNAPFSLANIESDGVSVHVDPHITKYTVYINHTTTWRVVAHDAMETYYTFMNTDHYPCASYQFCASASNVAGEGEKSGQVEGYFLQVPSRVEAEEVQALVTLVGTPSSPQIAVTLHLHLEKSCPARTPDLIVTATRSFTVYNGNVTLQAVTNTLNDSGRASAFTIYTNVSSTDCCCLTVQISAGNSAGISAPTEVAFVCQSTDNVTANTTKPTAHGNDKEADINDSSNNQRGESWVNVLTAVTGSASGGTLLLIAVVVAISVITVILRRRPHYKGKDINTKDITLHRNQAYEGVPNNIGSTMSAEMQPCPAYAMYH